ncbi:PAS domain S-box protein [Methylomonas sp. MK1]|uniref:PAS domain S-box protein n=1 Tax=Methylomonas sp. MK1 TaxID=1131552 RepID=UPI000379E30A|nr:PAS domain S-box protein [Methylomonas sp. MK1]
MNEILKFLTDNNFMPHGYCLSWSPGLLWTFVISDGLIFLSYFLLPVALGYFARHRQDFPYVRVLWLFVVFILACGTTHLMDVVVIWEPLYGLDAFAKVVTAIVSVVTVAVLIPLIPKALQLPSPAQLREANQRLQLEVAERERVEQALKAANVLLEQGLVAERTQLAALVNSSDDAIIGKNLEGIVTSWNAAAERIFGYSAAEIVGQPITLLFPAELLATEAELLQRIVNGERISNYETQRLRKDGSRIDVAATVSAIKDSDGKVIGASKIVRDITERKRIKAALRESEANFRRLFDVAPVPMALVAADGSMLALNQSIARSFGYTLSDIPTVEDWWRKAYPDPVYRQSVFDSWQNLQRRAAEQQAPIESLEYQVTCKNGEVRTAIISGITMGDNLLASLVDITERKRAEETLRKLSLVVEQSPESIVITDLDARIEYVNEAVIQTTGYSRAELLGQKASLLKSGKTKPEYFVELWDNLTNGRSWQGEFINKRKDGREFVESAIVAPIRQQDGRISHYMAIKDDITEKKQMLQELENYREHLEELVVERTEQLADAMQAAEVANVSKSAFLANMSHEIRTPMNAIIGLTHLLQNTTLDAKQREQLAKISVAAQHLLGIINDILDFSKIEAGKLVLDIGDFDLDQVFKNLNDLICDRAAEKGLEVINRIDPALPAVLRGDALRLGQILLNFASNAVKFTDAGHIVFRAKLIAKNPAGIVARFEISDTGIGMNAEQCSRLFQAFEQADSTTSRRFGGTGLGLAISKRLIEMMGGTVGVASELGRGSTFWLELPFEYAVGSSQQLPKPDIRKGLKVLVVDDVAEAREAIAHMLTRFEARVSVADSGLAAVQNVVDAQQTDSPFDLVLMDWMMPGMDGIQTAHRMGELFGESLPKIVLVTAYSYDGSAEELRSAGIVGHLAKPVTLSALHDTIAGVLSGWRQKTSADTRRPDLSSLKGRRVLLAEDNLINQEVALELLQEAGLVVDLAENGRIACDMAAKQLYDLILLDVQMPEMDGIAASLVIRRMPGREKTPILAMTANAFDEDRRACLSAGMNDHIPKPVNPEVLYDVMLRWMPPLPPAQSAQVHKTSDEQNDGNAALHERLANIPGLDLQAGLHNLQNKLPFYLRQLRHFAQRHAAEADNIRQLLAVGDWESAQRAAHSLKSSAATLGITHIRQTAEGIEMALKQQAAAAADSLQRPLKQLTEQLALFIKQILDVLPAERALQEISPSTYSEEALRAVVEGLRILLEEGNIQSQIYVQNHREQLRQAFGHEGVASLMRHVEVFAFDQALDVLQRDPHL